MMSTDKPYIVYRKGYKYQLVSPYAMQTDIHPDTFIDTQFIKLDPDGTLWIDAGYAWDGASGPTVDTLDSMRGSLIHDALYQLLRLGLLPRSFKDAADKLFREILIEDGMPEIRADVWYTAVTTFAGFATKASAEKKLIVAPRQEKKLGGLPHD